MKVVREIGLFWVVVATFNVVLFVHAEGSVVWPALLMVGGSILFLLGCIADRDAG